MNQPHRKQQQPVKKVVHNNYNGWINLDKPLGMTSTQTVGAVKRLLRPKKIGHAGTLDPLASGVLPLALGEATKTVPYLVDATKTYRFTLKFGEETATCDAEGEVTEASDKRPTDAEILTSLPVFTGVISQVPPVFSAIKINGVRAYDLARAGEEVEMKPRAALIHSFTLLERMDADHAVFEVVCGKGTYIRSLARDLARHLGACGHVAALRRLAVGGFVEKNIISLEKLEEIVQINRPAATEAEGTGNLMMLPSEVLLPVTAALDDIPAIRITKEHAMQLRHGQAAYVARTDFPAPGGEHDGIEQLYGAHYKAVCSRELIAIVERKGNMIAPVRVFAAQEQ